MKLINYFYFLQLNKETIKFNITQHYIVFIKKHKCRLKVSQK